MSALPSTIGHNSSAAPLDEMLTEETIDLVKRADDLLASFGRTSVTDEETAGKATSLYGLMRKHVDVIEEQRQERKKPVLETGRVIDSTYNGIIGKLAVYDTKKKLIGGPMKDLENRVDIFRREMKRKADVEAARLAEEARQAAIEAARLAEEAKEQPITVENEIVLQQAQEHADHLTRLATQAPAAPIIRSEYGFSASSRAVFTGKITDLKKAVAHALKVDRAGVEEAVQKIVDRQIRAKVRDFPGVEITEDSATRFRG